jgi:hypothetical protein
MWGTTRTRSRSSEARFQPRIGEAFELQEVHVIDAKTRGFLSRAMAIGCGGGIAVSGCYGLATGSFIAVEVVWAVAGPMLGAMVTHYFGSTGKDTR